MASADAPAPADPATTAAVEEVLVASSRAVPGARHVAICVLERGGTARTVAATGAPPRELDELQLALREGPTYDALRGDLAVASSQWGCPDDLARWPRVAAAAGSLGLARTLAVRLAWEGKTVGALSLSWDQPGCLTEQVENVATVIARHAAATLVLARKAEHLELAMVTRQEIGQAVGILMERYGLGADAAFSYLRRLSQNGNVKLRDIAEQLRLTGRLPGEEMAPASGPVVGLSDALRGGGDEALRRRGPVQP